MDKLYALVREHPKKLKLLFSLVNKMKPKGKYYQLTLNPGNLTFTVYDSYMNEIGDPAVVPIPNSIFVTDEPIKFQSLSKSKWKAIVDNPESLDIEKIILTPAQK